MFFKPFDLCGIHSGILHPRFLLNSGLWSCVWQMQQKVARKSRKSPVMWGLSNSVCLQGGAAVRTLYSRTSHFSHLVKKLRFILRLFVFNRVSNWTLDKTPHQITQQLDNSVDGVRNYCLTLWMVGKATPVQISCALEEAQSLVVSCASDEMRGCCDASKIKMPTNEWRSEVRVRNVTQCVAHCACATFWLLNIVWCCSVQTFFYKKLAHPVKVSISASSVWTRCWL